MKNARSETVHPGMENVSKGLAVGGCSETTEAEWNAPELRGSVFPSLIGEEKPGRKPGGESELWLWGAFWAMLQA